MDFSSVSLLLQSSSIYILQSLIDQLCLRALLNSWLQFTFGSSSSATSSLKLFIFSINGWYWYPLSIWYPGILVSGILLDLQWVQRKYAFWLSLSVEDSLSGL